MIDHGTDFRTLDHELNSTVQIQIHFHINLQIPHTKTKSQQKQTLITKNPKNPTNQVSHAKPQTSQRTKIEH